MKYIHVKNLEHFHPGYRDRKLQWAKIYFTMIQGDPETEMLHEIDRARLVSFILLELEAQQPIPLDKDYFLRKGFDLKIRPISVTIKLLHNFIELVDDKSKTCVIEKSKRRVDKESTYVTDNKKKYGDNVYLSGEEFQKLTNAYGPVRVNQIIAKLDNYKGSSGKTYKSDYKAILSWVVKSVTEENKIPGGILPT